jgi:flagella basal body P-ring formation protein FlgA
MKLYRIFLITAFVILTRGGLGLSTLASEPSALPPADAAADTNAAPRLLPFGTAVETNTAPHVLDEPGLKELLTTALQRDYVRDMGELDLTLGRTWAPLTISNAPVALRVIEVPTLGVNSSFIVRFELSAGDQHLGLWQMPLMARVWRDVWIARSPLRRGQRFADADCLRERRDVLTIREAYLGGLDPSGLELAENVSAGATVMERHLRPRTLVHRGQIAQAVARDGTMEISLKVEVLEDGSLGQQVRVRNLLSKREFRGKVEDEGTVSVSL